MMKSIIIKWYNVKQLQEILLLCNALNLYPPSKLAVGMNILKIAWKS